MFAKESVLPKYCLARTLQIPKFLRSQLEKVSLFANFHNLLLKLKSSSNLL